MKLVERMKEPVRWVDKVVRWMEAEAMVLVTKVMERLVVSVMRKKEGAGEYWRCE